METREIQALQIAASMPLRRSTHGWIVPSQTGHGSYKVTPTQDHLAQFDLASEMSCTCPDFELRQLPCKHVMAVEYAVKREVTAEGEILDQEPSVTYTQNWAAYNKAQCEEKDRFLPMLADLCSTIPQPEQGRGRPRLPMSDMAFAAVSKVYSGMSGRRHDSDVREEAAKGLHLPGPALQFRTPLSAGPGDDSTLRSLVELSALPLKGIETDFAADSTGFSTCRFVRWYDHKWGREEGAHGPRVGEVARDDRRSHQRRHRRRNHRMDGQ